MNFSGTITALVTPFCKNGSVDYQRLGELVEEQISGGVSGLVPVGTTGESPTLTMEEHCKVIAFVAEKTAKRIPVIAGTGGNSTQEALHLTKEAIAMGVDGTLQVCPYYNKPSQEGLYRHFSLVADLGLPVVLYNVPGRSSREISVETVKRLAAHPNVVAVKEAGGSVARASAVIAACGIDVLSGDDMLALPMIAVGAKGVISVASGVIPSQMSQMVDSALKGDFATAKAIHIKYHSLFRDLFIDTNPIPVKAALAMMGKIEEIYRLPLCEMDAAGRERLRQTLSALDIVRP